MDDHYAKLRRNFQLLYREIFFRMNEKSMKNTKIKVLWSLNIHSKMENENADQSTSHDAK